MHGRPHSDITAQGRCKLNGVDVKTRLTLSKHAFNQMGDSECYHKCISICEKGKMQSSD